MNNSHKFLIAFLTIHLAYTTSYSQAGEWTWVKGDSIPFSSGYYGIPGVSDSTSEPYARYACGSWTDTAGNFWIYGGVFNLSDLWMFNPSTNNWTWMSGDTFGGDPHWVGPIGSYSSQNSPGGLGYGMFTWTTANNHLWLFGGGDLFGNDTSVLWQYDPAINQWAWMGVFGPPHYGTKGIGDTTTYPGGREEGNAAWTDSIGNLWLFGGQNTNNLSGADLNDMWKYDIATGIWTWMSGSDNPGDTGSYGTIGTPSINNYPSARSTNLFWKDNSGNFWLGGGGNWNDDHFFQDLWKFNPQTLEWTWLRGSNNPDDSMPRGTVCINNSSNSEGARFENRCLWKICDDLIVNYGGFSDFNAETNFTNDLWAYSVSQATWLKISSGSLAGNYGSKGVSSPLNYPPARFGSVGFKDKQNNIWMFGGYVQDQYFSNDLWKYVVDTSCLGNLACRSCNLAPPLITTNKNSFCADDSAHICAPSGFNSYQWNAGDNRECIYANAAGAYYLTVTDANGCTAESNHVSIAVFPVHPVSITKVGDTLSTFGGISYQWYVNGNQINADTSPIYIATVHGSYTVAVIDSNGCEAISSPVAITGLQELTETYVEVYPNPSSIGSWQLVVDNSLVGSLVEIYDLDDQLVFRSIILRLKSEIAPSLSRGVYLLHISSSRTNILRKLIRL